MNEQNISITLQSALDRLASIESRITEKNTEAEKVEKETAIAKAELVEITQKVETAKNELHNQQASLVQIKDETDVARETLRSEYEKGIGKLEALYLKLCDAKEALLKTLTENVSAKEKETFVIIDTIQEKKRALASTEKEISETSIQLENTKKSMFTLQTKFDDLREKEEFIKKKYEDAGIPYN